MKKKASSNTYMKTRDGILIFDDYRKFNYPLFHIKKQSADVFSVIIFRSGNEIFAELLNDEADLNSLYQAVWNKEMPEDTNKKAIIAELFETISKTVMNQGSTVVMNSVPMFILKITKYSLKDLFKLLVSDHQMHPRNFEKWFGKISDEEANRFDYKKWKIHYDKQRIDEISVKKVIDSVEKLTSFASMIHYGDIIFLKDMIGDNKYRGDYYEKFDAIRVSIDDPTKMIHTIIHEMGHRYHFKFIKQKSKQLVFEKFKDLKLRKDLEELNLFKPYASPTSLKNDGEFFADIWTAYCLKILSPKIKQWFEGAL
jgi:hypothetical protein